jgi:hypothetical protein
LVYLGEHLELMDTIRAAALGLEGEELSRAKVETEQDEA